MVKAIVGALVMTAALAACGGNASTSSSTSAAPAGSSSAAAGSPSAAPSPLPSGEAGAICNDISVEIIAGDGAQSGIQGAMAIYHVSEAQVIAAVAASCPQLSKDMPAS
jgi:hypothetical protein